MGAADSKLNLLLTGKTGSGKSSSGNAIAGKEVFGSFNATTSSTRRVTPAKVKRFDKDITLFDTPGLMETSMEEVEQRYFARSVMEDAFKKTESGFHAIVIVLNYIERYSEEDRQVITMLKNIFGAAFLNFTILIFTHGDNFDMDWKCENNPDESQNNFLDWCTNSKNDDLKELLKQCNFRAVLFHNNSDYKENRHVELRHFVKHVEGIKRSKKLYTKWNFADAKRTRDQLLLTTCLSSLKSQIISEFQILNHEFELLMSQQTTLLERADEVLEAMSNNCESRFPDSDEVYATVKELIQSFRDDLTNGEKYDVLCKTQKLIGCPVFQKLRLLSQDTEILLSPEKRKFLLKRRIKELLQHIKEEAHGTNKLAAEEERVKFLQSDLDSFEINTEVQNRES